MAKQVGIFEGLRAGIQSEEEIALQWMFPARSNFKRLQMMTHHSNKSMVPLSVMGLFQRMYKSQVLKIFQEELGYNKIALDRLGRVEGSEIVAARRKAREEDTD